MNEGKLRILRAFMKVMRTVAVLDIALGAFSLGYALIERPEFNLVLGGVILVGSGLWWLLGVRQKLRWLESPA